MVPWVIILIWFKSWLLSFDVGIHQISQGPFSFVSLLNLVQAKIRVNAKKSKKLIHLNFLKVIDQNWDFLRVRYFSWKNAELQAPWAPDHSCENYVFFDDGCRLEFISFKNVSH